MKSFQIFTDGGAFAKDKQKTHFVAVSTLRIFDQDKKMIFREGTVYDEHTGAFAEVNAICRALKAMIQYMEASKDDKVDIRLYTDSMTYFRSLTEWIYGWIKNARDGVLYSTNGTPVLHQETIKRAFEYMNKIRNTGKIKFFHIKSHGAKCRIDELKKEFEKFNKCKLTDEEFAFIYLQNKKCDDDVKIVYDQYIEKLNATQQPNNTGERSNT